ncbi:DUF2064 domain-containing protein [bacterium]|nr:DUF2064 domain-containing protein [bacterium]MBU1024582.1 DUF2064 domain-containing protein [bacterium]
MKQKITIILFALKPARGKVKTRLAKELGADVAVKIYKAMCEDIWNTIKSLNVPAILATDINEAWLPEPEHVLVQPDGNFGCRLESIIRQTAELGYKSAITLSPDTPHLAQSIIGRAIEILNNGDADVVASPSDDGGLVLSGFKLPLSVEIQNLPFETDLLATVVSDLKNEFNVEIIEPVSFDIDTIEDAQRLLRESEKFKDICPNTIRILELNVPVQK